MAYYSRKPTRIPEYDYSKCNYYFITMCSYEKKCIFGKPGDLNHNGKIVETHIKNLESYYKSLKVDNYVVMPNHVHMILILEDQEENPNISSVVGAFKTGVTKAIRMIEPNKKVWQRSFHDHIIRNQKSYERIWMYIEDNPRRWEEDCFFDRLMCFERREG